MASVSEPAPAQPEGPFIETEEKEATFPYSRVNSGFDSLQRNSFSASADGLVPVLPAGGLLWKEKREKPAIRLQPADERERASPSNSWVFWDELSSLGEHSALPGWRSPRRWESQGSPAWIASGRGDKLLIPL